MEGDEEPDLRDSLSDAFDASESADVVADADITPAAPEPKVEPVTDTAPKTADLDPKTADLGEKPAAKGAAGLDIPTLGLPAEKKGQTVPGTWKPGPREHWEALPEDVKTEIGRREREISAGMRETVDARRTASEFQSTVQPYMHFIESEGSTPIQAVKNMMQTAAIFRTGTAQQKAQTAAHIIKNFGIDLPMLDSMLAGSYQQDPVQAQINEQLAPVHALQKQVHDMQRERMESVDSSASQSIEAFGADPANEFFADVRETMADILDLAAQRGQAMDLSAAYNRAIMMHDDISEVVTQRKLAVEVGKRSEPARRARAKAVSVTGAPAQGETPPQSGNMRDDILNAIDAQATD